MKVKNLKGLKNIKISVPVDGTVDLDGEGCFEASDKCALALTQSAPMDWQKVTKTQPIAPANAGNTGDNEGDEDEGEGEEGDDNAEIIDGIKKMTLKQMVETATEAGYPEEEWKSFNIGTKKALFAAYLIKKFEESLVEEPAGDGEGEEGDDEEEK